MQKYHGSDWSYLGFEHIGSVPVLRKAFRIDGTAFEIAIDRYALVRVEYLTDVTLHIRENLVFGLEIIRPIGVIESFACQLVRDVGVPGLQRWSTLRIIDAERQEPHDDHDEQQRNSPQ